MLEQQEPQRCSATLQPFCKMFLTLILSMMGLLIVLVGWCIIATKEAQAQSQQAIQELEVFEAKQDEAGVRIQQSLDYIADELKYQRVLLEAKD